MSDIKLPPIFPTLQKREPQKKQLRTKFNLDPEFFSQLILRLREREKVRQEMFSFLRRPKHPPKGWIDTKPKEPPSFTNLAEGIIAKLIETVFWASLERDEGRALRFSVAYKCLIEGESESDFFDDTNVIFETPLAFNVKELKKLGPAVRDRSSVLVFEERGSLKIRGISADGYLPLRFHVLDPGHLTLSYYGENVGFVSGSEVGFLRFSQFEINSLSAWSRLYPDRDEKLPWWKDARPQLILSTLRKMRNLGGGGALLVVPRRKGLKRSIESATYPCANGFNEVSRKIREHHESDDKEARLGEFFINHHAETLAHLTAVDGATIITRDLELLGFGIKLKRTSAPAIIYMSHPIDHPTGWKAVSLQDIGNLRHQSAARFVASQTDSVAFVVSQDGNITSFAWVDATDKHGPYLLVDSRLDLTLS